jgi:hypothetical protein
VEVETTPGQRPTAGRGKRTTTQKLALAALICGLASALFAYLTGLPAIIMAVFVLARADSNPKDKKFALWGLVLAIILTMIFLVVATRMQHLQEKPGLSRSPESNSSETTSPQGEREPGSERAGTAPPQETQVPTDSERFAREIAAVLRGDIFESYRDELAQYDSDLKKKHFLGSAECRDYEARLRARKRDLLSGSYSMLLTQIPGIEKYDLDTGSFELTVGEMIRKSDGYGNMNAINGFWFPMFNVEQSFGLFKILRLKIPESVALEIEGKDSEVLALFRLTGRLKEYERQWQAMGITFQVKDYYPVVKDVMLVVFSDDGRELYRIPMAEKSGLWSVMQAIILTILLMIIVGTLLRNPESRAIAKKKVQK